VLLTVVGSIYLAGSIWSDLPALWRQALVWGYLAVCAAGFARVGRRLESHPGGESAARWLIGVSVALAPVHALATGGLWKLGGATSTIAAGIGLIACTAFHGNLLRRTLPALSPVLTRQFQWTWLALAISVGLIPLMSGPGWLLVPTMGALVALWAGMTQGRKAGWLPALLVAEPLAFHVLFTEPGPPSAYGPFLVLAALGCLYLDAARARWRGVLRTHANGPLGLAALACAGGALLLLGSTMSPLPTTGPTLLSTLLLVPFFAAATTSWRRPVVWMGGLLSALLFFLALPSQFAIAVAWLGSQAGQALGYTDEPLPLPWYSLTLLPYLFGVRWLEGWLSRTGWRQSAELSRKTLVWGAGLSFALALAAHGRWDDLRPALLALPLHALLWTWGRQLRHTGWAALLGLVGLVWAIDAMAWTGASAPATLTLAGLLICAAAWSARAWLPQAERCETPLALIGLPALLMGLAGLADLHGLSDAGWAWGSGALALGAVVGVLGTERWCPDRTGPAKVLELVAHLLAGLAVVMAMALHGLPRTLAKLPVAIALVHWLWRHKHPAYGALLCLGLAEMTARRALGLGLADFGLVAALAAAAAWIPVACRAAGLGRKPWLDWSLAFPSAVVGAMAATASLALMTIQGFDSPFHVAAVAGFAGAVWLGGRRFTMPALEKLAWALATWTVVALVQWLGAPPETLGWVLACTAAGLVVLPGKADWARLNLVVATGAGVIAVTTGDVASVSLPLLSLALGWLAHVAWRRPELAWTGALLGGSLAASFVSQTPMAAMAALIAAGVLLAMLTGARRDRPTPAVAALLGLVWLGQEWLTAGEPVLVALVGLHGLGLVLARARDRHPALSATSWALAIPLWTAAALCLPSFNDQNSSLALLAVVTVAGIWGRRKGLLTVWLPYIAIALTAFTPLLEPSLLSAVLVILGLSLRKWLPVTTVLCLLLSVGAESLLFPSDLSAWVLLAPVAAAIWEFRLGWVRDQGWRWWTALSWAVWALLLARVAGPLAGLPESWLLPLAVGIAVSLEGLRAAVQPAKGEEFVRPLVLSARTLPLLMLAICLPLEGLTPWGVGLVGCLSLVRFVFKPRTSDLLIGVALVDLASLWALGQAQVSDPVAWVAPVSLSLLVVARILRDALGPQVVATLRYVASGALYLAAFSNLVVTPGGSLLMLVLGLAGVALGTMSRVKAYLHLGVGVAVATLIADGLRFGLEHSQFWALYLTGIGLTILGTMVAATLHRERLNRIRLRWRTAMAGWE
jgi:hypothetical protein